MTLNNSDEPFVIDNSILAAMSRCSTEALLRYAQGFTSREENANLMAGRAGHMALAAWFGGESKEKVLEIFWKEYSEWSAENVMTGDRLEYINLDKILRQWLDEHPIQGFPFQIAKDRVEV